jgi:ABC-type Fe3+/spermidine/putrescine transport system ATPase subunit
MTISSEPVMLQVTDVVHRYGNVTALDHVSLSAAKGEFLTILGSSGSGKTTMLRVISGLETPASIRALKINGEDVVGKPPAKRSCTTVFQNYALFPHMSVSENVAYGLKVRGVAREDARLEALKALAMVQLEGKSDRRIAQLSGGERQRVALARAVVTRPAILLLDEPLGALDEKLRLEMQIELVEIQRTLGMTFVYITHSQEEALTMSDRVVLMRHGRIEQSGRPLDLFDRPANRFAAEFMGYENIFEGRLVARDNAIAVIELSGGLIARGILAENASQVGSQVCLAVRAERMTAVAHSHEEDAAFNVLPGTLQRQVYRGKYTDQAVETPLGAIRLRNWNRVSSTEAVRGVAWRPEDCVILSA